MNAVNPCDPIEERAAAARERYVKMAEDGALLAVDAADWVAVLDTATNLIWSRAHSPKRMTQQKAVGHCKKLELLDRKDWQAPTRVQLLSLVDDTRFDPAIDIRFFPECPASWFWTNTDWAPSPADYAWIVYFSNGYSDVGYRHYKGFVRAVCPGQ